MTLPNLATAADLSTRGVSIADDDLVLEMLAVASSLVRAAAGGPISETTSTLTLWGLDRSQWLDLPGGPVTSVDEVVHDGRTLTGGVEYKLVNGRLWGANPWGDGDEPLEVVVTLTHGLPEVPAHVRNLVVDLTILGLTTARDGARDTRVVTESIDDYSVTFAAGAEAVASAMEVPALTRHALRQQFGAGVGMVTTR